MSLYLYNSLSRKKELFKPQDPQHVSLYVCGPTVYNYAHIGNGRSAVCFDILFRVLRHYYGKDYVIYARNITDIDDKINKAAIEQKIDISIITNKFAKIYQDDLLALGNLPPTIEPRATQTIDHIIEMIKRLIEKNYAYQAEGHVLFDVTACDDYGALSGRDRKEMIAGARVEVAPYKKDPADFVLWKPSTPDLPGWDSPWGKGRPGWHIECSAMIKKHLGETIDIHCGGLDLIFPHHENEIIQSKCSHDGKPLANFWLHNGYLTIGEDKMGKSLGNVLLIHDLINQYSPEALRMALLSAHYRQPLMWNDSLIDQSLTTLDKFYKKLKELEEIKAEPSPSQEVIEALSDDLNTPKAMAVLFAHLKDETLTPKQLKSYLLGGGLLMGIFQQSPDAWITERSKKTTVDESYIEKMIEQRSIAKKEKNFTVADQIRDDLLSKGIILEDKPDQTIWRTI